MREHRVITPSVLYFGTPVAVVSSVNGDGSTNIAPISSYWALDDLVVIGLGASGQTARNLRERPDLIVNLFEDDAWQQIDALGRLTGTHPVPADKRPDCRFEADKFAAVGWKPVEASPGRPARIAEASVHIAASVSAIDEEQGGLVVVRARAGVVHADERIVVEGTSHVDPQLWRPLIYSFRHYFGLGVRRGVAPHADVPSAFESRTLQKSEPENCKVRDSKRKEEPVTPG